ncbi:adhesion G-protein coupled receptor V1-like isoform X2 [Haliotis rufescens]|uniref:adhesion G-protein coupled receptor V1-like isoform X2 n=1 Tax=Haliotis rufescens TaxID=6454 RepID=UPI00201FA673|nr:adhesion G-protein coupled receptor V1-like isoform X2 [Haliotis rufescens]
MASRMMSFIRQLVIFMALFVFTVTGQATVRFLDTNLIVKEGDQFDLRVQRTGSITSELVVIVAIESDLSDDFIGDTQVARFTPTGSDTVAVTFTVRDDDEAEADEVSILQITIVGRAAIAVDPSQTRVTILANDDAYGVFGFTEASPRQVIEKTFTEVINIKIGRQRGSFGSIMVSYMINGSSLEADVERDIAPRSGFVRFQPNERENNLQLQIRADDIPENAETFTVYLVDTSPMARIDQTRSSFTFIIQANDAPLGFRSPVYRFAEGPGSQTYSVQVNRGLTTDGFTKIGSLSEQATVQYSVSPGTAQQNVDFTASNGQLVFGPEETVKSISFVVLDDNQPEMNETFQFRLSTFSGDVVWAPNAETTTVVISANDNQNGVISFRTENSTTLNPEVRVNEDTYSVAVFQVVRNAGTFGRVTATWEISHYNETTDQVTSDVGPLFGVVEFQNGANTAEIRITIVQDTFPEPAEKFVVTLQEATGGATIEGVTQAFLLIEDSDDMYGRIEFDSPFQQQIKNTITSRSLKLQLKREGGRFKDLTANISLTYYDNANRDRTDEVLAQRYFEMPLLQGLDIIMGEVPLLPKAFLQTGGRFDAYITDVIIDITPEFGNYNSPVLQSRRQVSIPVTATNANGEIGFADISDVLVEEPTSGSRVVQLKVNREGSSGPVNIRWIVTGVGESASSVTSADFDSMTGVVLMASGVSEIDITLSVRADETPEINETVTVELRIEGSSVERLRPGSAEVNVTILANDNPAGVFEFSTLMQNSYRIQEGSEAVTVIVERSGGALTMKEVEYRVSPRGTEEFYGGTSVLRFAPGETRATGTLVAKSDGIPELDELFSLQLLTYGTPAAQLGARVSIPITVAANDAPGGIIQFSMDPTIVYMGESTSINTVFRDLNVQRSRGTFGQVSVAWELPSSAQADLTPTSGTITFTEGQAQQTIRISSVADDIPESDETYILQLSPPTGNAQPGVPMRATIVIRQNDHPLEFTEVWKDVIEPSQVQFTIQRTGRLTDTTKVRYRTLDGSASSVSNDYTSVDSEVTFNPGETEKSFFLEILDDNLPEGNETFQVQLYNLGGDFILTNRSTATVMILANDDAYGVFRFKEPLAKEASEGETIYFDIMRDQGSFGEVDVSWQIRDMLTNQVVTDTREFETTSGVIQFKESQGQLPIIIKPLPDDIPENEKTYNVVLTGVSVVSGRTNTVLAKLDSARTVGTLKVRQSDEPFGKFAFPAMSDEKNIDEDVTPGQGGQTSATFTVERQQGSLGNTQVLWEVFSERMGGNPPKLVDLIFVGNRPSTVTTDNSKRRRGTGTDVLLFSGGTGSYVTVPAAAQPLPADIMNGFSLSAWVQPQPNTNGYILAKTSADGLKHFYSLKLLTSTSSSTIELALARSNTGGSHVYQGVTSVNLMDGNWHHILASVANGSAKIYMDGMLISTRALLQPNIIDEAGALFVGARSPGAEFYLGHMQDVRVFLRSLVEEEILEIYETPAIKDIMPISGTLTYTPGVRTSTFNIQSLQDIEEESNEVFSVTLVSVNGGAAISDSGFIATLTVLKSDNSNGLYGFTQSCQPSRTGNESALITCVIGRSRGDDGVVTITWVVQQDVNSVYIPAVDDFVQARGAVTFSPGEREKRLQFQIKEDNLPEKAEIFRVYLESAISGDGQTGSTNQSGASIDPSTRSSNLIIDDTDYPHGMLQFSALTSPPQQNDPMIIPATQPVTVMAREEDRVASLLVVRAQGLIGEVSVEWRTIDGTARSSGKSPPDYIGSLGAASRFVLGSQQRYGYLNITLLDNSIPEPSKTFRVELVNPGGGASVGPGSTVNVIIGASDGAFGIYQFANDSLAVQAQETGDIGFNSISLNVVRLGGSYGTAQVTWQATNDNENDLMMNSGQINFAESQTSAATEIQIRGDLVPELDENINIVLTATTEGDLGDTSRRTAVVTILANDGPYGVFTIADKQRPVIVQEGNSDVSITIQRQNGKFGTVDVSYASLLANESYNYLPGQVNRAGSSDFLSASGTVRFLPNQEYATFSVTVLDDDLPELDESIFVELKQAILTQGAQQRPVQDSPRLGQKSQSYAQIIISRNDDASGRVELSASSLEVTEESGPLQLFVNRVGGTFGEITVRFSTIDLEASKLQDYIITGTEQVILSDGEAQKRLPIRIENDFIPETSERFRIELLDSITGGASLGSARQAIVTILPSDDPNGAFGFATTGVEMQELANGQNPVRVTVSRTGGVRGVITVNWEAKLNGVLATADITPASGQLYFVSNEGSKQIDIFILPDDIPEGEERINITLTSANNGGRITDQNSFILSIAPNDNPHGVVQFLQPSYSLNEIPGSQPQSLALQRYGGVYGRLRVYYTTSQTPLSDLAVELTRPLVTYYYDPQSGRRFDGITLDVSQESNPFMACSSFCLNREDCRAYTYRLDNVTTECFWHNTDFSGPLSPDVNAQYYVKNATTVAMLKESQSRPGADYVAVTEASVIVDDQASSAQLPVTIIDDSLPELAEKFQVTLLRVVVDDPAASTSQNPTLGNIKTATVIIPANDEANGLFSIYSSQSATQSEVLVQERDRQAVNLIVERTGGTIGEVSVEWSVAPGASATYQVDFIADGATLVFQEGVSRTVVTVTILDDTIPEDRENFTIQLSNPRGGAQIGPRSNMTVVILENDNVAGVVSLDDTAKIATEGESFTCRVSRTSPAYGTVVVSWTIDGINGLLPQNGFRQPSGTLTFAPGELFKVISLTVLTDDTPEVNEEYRLRLYNPITQGVGVTGAATINPLRSSALITIRGSDNPHGLFQFALTSQAVRVEEDVGRVNLQVDRKFGTIGAVQVSYNISAGSVTPTSTVLILATANEDFGAMNNGQITIPDGAASGTIVVDIRNDDTPEIDEVFIVSLTGVALTGSDVVPFPPQLASNVTSEVIISANDGTKGLIMFGESSRSFSVQENNMNVSLAVVRDRGTFGQVSVYFYSQAITPGIQTGVDYKLTPQEITFAAGENSKNMLIEIMDDNAPEPNEVFEVILANPQGAALGSFATATVTILANDDASGIIDLADNSTVVLREPTGDNLVQSKAELRLYRGPGNYGMVRVPFTITSADNTPVTDIVPASGFIIFEDLSIRSVLEIRAVDDNIPEDLERFTLTLQSPDNNAKLGSMIQKDITIEPNDSPQGLFEIFVSNTRNTSTSLEESPGLVNLDIIRSRGSDGTITVNVNTVAETALTVSSQGEITVALLQNIPSVRVSGWHSFSVGGTTYILMLTSLPTGTTLRSQVPAGPYQGDGQSALFRWQGEAVYVSTVASDGATAATSFVLDGVTYLMLANGGREGRREVDSVLYTVTEQGILAPSQVFRTFGASDVKFVSHQDQHFLVISHALNNASQSNQKVSLHIYNTVTKQFGVSPWQEISTLYAHAISLFNLDGVLFMAVASYYDSTKSSYETNSAVYKMGDSFRFSQHQTLATQGAMDVEYVNTSTMQLLVFANNRQNVVRSPQQSGVYRYDSATKRFLNHQFLETTRTESVASVTDGENLYLAFANTLSSSIVYKWNRSRSVFESAWIGATQRRLEPVVIQQSNGLLLLLAGAPVDDGPDGATIFQIAQVNLLSDFVPRLITMTFYPGETVRHTTAVVLQDNIPEDTETFRVSLIDPTAGAEIGQPGSVIVSILSNDNAHGIIEFSDDSLSVLVEEENGRDTTIQLNVNRKAGHFGRVVIRWAATGDHTGTSDITPLSGQVEFANGQVLSTITMTVRDDVEAEFAEDTYVQLVEILERGTTLPNKGAILGQKITSKVTVQANDSPHGVVSWETSLTTTIEPQGTDSTLQLKIIREQGTEGSIRVFFVTSTATGLAPDNRAVAGVDYVSRQGSVTMAGGIREAEVAITVKQDNLPEPDESFYVNITSVELVGSTSTSSAQPSIRTQGGYTQVRITQNDDPGGIVQFNVTLNVEGRVDTYEEYGSPNKVLLPLSRVSGLFGEVLVTWQAQPIEANTDDFSPADGTVRFQNGQSSAQIEISIIDDTSQEPMEMFDVRLISATGGARISTFRTVRVAILKNDSPTGLFRFQTSEVSTKESSSSVDPEGQATLVVERVQGAQGLVLVEWRLAANAEDDFLPPLQGTLTFNQGEARKSIVLQTKPDTILEGEERFVVSLTSASNNANIAVKQADATVIIAANGGSSGTVSIEATSRTVYIGEPNVAQGYNGQTEIVLTRGNGIYGAISVTWSLSPRESQQFQQVEGTINFVDQQQTATVVLEAKDDTVPELRKAYTFVISAATGGATVTADDSGKLARVVFVASDYPHGRFEFSQPQLVSVGEDVGTVQIEVRRQDGNVGQVQVSYTSTPDTAVSDQDYFPVAGTLRFESGVQTMPIQVTIKPDDLPEGPEQFYLNLTSAQLLSPTDNDYSKQGNMQLDMRPGIGGVDVKTILIQKNDNAEGTIQFTPEAASLTVKEEDGVARVPLTRLGGSYGDVSVRYDIQSVSAIEGQDFVGTGGVVQFNSGVDAATVNVTLNDDTEMEFEETFTLRLTITTGGAQLGSRTTSTVTIAKSDFPNGEFRFNGQLDITMQNPSTEATIPVEIERTGGMLGGQTVSWRIMGPNNPDTVLDDTSDISYTNNGQEVTSGTLVWADAEVGPKGFTLKVKPYSSWEVEEVFIVKIFSIVGSSGNGNGEPSPTAGQIKITVQKFGSPNGVIGFDGAARSEREVDEPTGSGTLTLNFPLSRRADTGVVGTLQIFWEVEGPPGMVTDIQPVNGSIYLAAEERASVISIRVLPDEEPEMTETFKLVLKRIEGGADIDTSYGQSTFKIKYNDNPHGQYGILPGNQRISVDPSDLKRRLHLNFTRHDGSFGRTSLEYRATYDEPQIGITVSASTDSVTFEEGQSSATKVLDIGGNGFLEIGTTFTITLDSVQFLGPGVTDAPRLKGGQTEAKIPVPAPAANSKVSFKETIVNVNEDTKTVLLTVKRDGTYGVINVDWVSGLPTDQLPANTLSGEVTSAAGTVPMTHGMEAANFTVQVNLRQNQAELFAVRLPGPPKTTVDGGARIVLDQSVARIEPYGLIQFDVNSRSPQVTESMRQVTLTVNRLYGSVGRVEVRYSTQSASAQGNIDYRSIRGGVAEMNEGVVSATFNIEIYTDTLPEETETFHVNLTDVVMFPTPQNPVPSPRLSELYSTATVSITESNDPYGVLCLEPWTFTTQEKFTAIVLTVVRTGGVFGQVSVRVRTVGGDESWTSEISTNTGSTGNNTISEVLQSRDPASKAIGGTDYSVLDTTVVLQAGEVSKQVNVTILDDDTAEPKEVVLVYLTDPVGGARVGRGDPDGGKRGFAMITIQASDTSNGRIGFAQASKNVRVNEDTANPNATLTLIRQLAFFGEVRVSWKAKKSQSSSDTEDAALSSQLTAVSGVTVCPAGQQTCSLVVGLIDDKDPEEEFQFVVQLLAAVEDAELEEGSLFATVVIATSDFVRGLIGFNQASLLAIVGDEDKTVRLTVARTMGQTYDVEVSYETFETLKIEESGVDIYPAVASQDFKSQSGTLTFAAGSQNSLKTIDVELSPITSSNNPLPKQFRLRLKLPTNEASLHASNAEATVRIVKQKDVGIWMTIAERLNTPLTDPNIQKILAQLDTIVRDDLDDNNMKLLEDTLVSITKEGEKRKLSPEVVTSTLNLYCKLMEPGATDARKGKYSMAKSLEAFAYTLLKDAPCLEASHPDAGKLVSHECNNVKISAGRIPIETLKGFSFTGQRRDEFKFPNKIPSVPTTGTECKDVHFIEYNSDLWYQTENPQALLNGKIISIGIKGQSSGYSEDPVTFKIHSPDRRVSTSTAECVYFDESATKWTNPTDVCKVTNAVTLGDEDFVGCSCNHMTSYSVIAKTMDPGLVYYELWFYICCAVCMACLLIVIILHHVCFTQPMISASLFMHLLFAAFATQLCMVLSAYLSKSQLILVTSTTDNNYRCIIMGLFLHYFFVAQFTWIMTLAVNLWKLLVMNDEHTERKYVLFFFLGWGLPLLVVGIFYAVVFNLYKYVYTLPVDFIYGDVNNNSEMCFITNPYAALGGVIVPVLIILLVVCVVFIKAYQMSGQWESYDDIYRGRYNRMEIKLMLLVWGLLAFAWLWAGLHMVYGQLWLIVLFCVFIVILGLFAFIVYGILRNPCMPYYSTHKASYAVSINDFDSIHPSAVPHYHYQPSPGPASFKGSRASLLHEAWERDSIGPRSQMTVKRALPSQVYINPPVSIISGPSHSDMEDRDFDELLYALKAGGSFAPSEVSHGADNLSIQSDRLERYETKRIDIADTHL